MSKVFCKKYLARIGAAVLAVGMFTILAIFLPRPLMAQEADLVWTGVIEAAPSQGRRIGLWTVSGKQFAANTRTEFDAVEGPLVAGTCVHVDYRMNPFGGKIAEEIDSEPASYCRNGSATSTDGSSGERNTVHHKDDENKDEENKDEAHKDEERQSSDQDDGEDRWLYARIDAMPSSGLIGEWTIGGIRYITSRNTYFAQEEGRFDTGVCVDVEYIEGSPRRVLELKTESSYECR